MAVPTVYNKLLKAAPANVEMDNIRVFISGSAPLSIPVFDQWSDLGNGKDTFRILERYGMSECGMLLGNPLHGLRKPVLNLKLCPIS